MGEKRAQKNQKRQKRKQKRLRKKQPTNSRVQQQPVDDELTYTISISVSSDTVDALDVPIAKRLQEELGESEVAREFIAKPEADSEDGDVI